MTVPDVGIMSLFSSYPRQVPILHNTIIAVLAHALWRVLLCRVNLNVSHEYPAPFFLFNTPRRAVTVTLLVHFIYFHFRDCTLL